MPTVVVKKPSRNTIGGEPPQLPESMLERVELAKASKRPRVDMMMVQNPATKEVLTVTRPNGRDYINHLGWNEVVETADEDEPEEDDDAPVGVLADRATNGRTANELEELRTRIRETGALVDLRWGLKKLREQVDEIEKAEAAKADVDLDD